MKINQNPNTLPVKMNDFLFFFNSTSIKFMYFEGNIFHLPIWFVFVYMRIVIHTHLKCADAENKAIFPHNK